LENVVFIEYNLDKTNNTFKYFITIKTNAMTGLRRANNPFLTGQRPRRYFDQLISLMRQRASVSDERRFNPDWNKGKKAA